MTAYPLQNQTALFAGDKQPVHRYIQVAQQPGFGLPSMPTVLPRGTLLGRVPGSNGAPPTFLLMKAGATDGSQQFDGSCVLAADVDASAGSIAAPAYFDGEFAFERMYVDPSLTFLAIVAGLQNCSPPPGWYCRQLGILG